jgi:hypothetical protein
MIIQLRYELKAEVLVLLRYVKYELLDPKSPIKYGCNFRTQISVPGSNLG